jgi:hypothetical protein
MAKIPFFGKVIKFKIWNGIYIPVNGKKKSSSYKQGHPQQMKLQNFLLMSPGKNPKYLSKNYHPKLVDCPC